MFNIRNRAAYTRHCLRAHFGNFTPMSYTQFVRFGLFAI